MSRIVVALKRKSPKEAVQWAKNTEGKIWGLKFNDMLRNDLAFIQDVKPYCNVMADAKVFEIPEDMENQVRQLLEAGADIVTVHAAAHWTPPEDIRDKVVSVTVLTSFTEQMCRDVFGSSIEMTVGDFVLKSGFRGYGWFVSSAQDLKYNEVRQAISEYGIKPICPSIRMSGGVVKNDDQVRKATPAEAFELGAELLVIGRPILQASQPIDVINRINNEIIEAEKNLLDNVN